MEPAGTRFKRNFLYHRPLFSLMLELPICTPVYQIQKQPLCIVPQQPFGSLAHTQPTHELLLTLLMAASVFFIIRGVPSCYGADPHFLGWHKHTQGTTGF